MILHRWRPCSTRSTVRLASSQPTEPMMASRPIRLQHSSTANIVIPPRSTAIPNSGRTAWSTGQAHSGNRKRRPAEMAGGHRLWQACADRNRHRAIQGADRIAPAGSFVHSSAKRVAIGCIVLNRVLACGRPESARHQVQPA